jgi:hypothetical protein
MSFRNLYQASPPELKQIVLDQWKAKQNPDWHPEGNTLKHIITVTNRAFRDFPDSKDIQLAAYFHDLGKLATYDINPKTGKPTAHGHEKESTALIKKFSSFIQQQGANPEIVEYIVKNHMRIKPSTWDVMKPSKKDPIINNPHYQDLEKFGTVDKGGLLESQYLLQNKNCMKEQILSEEFRRMQVLAGIITESKIITEAVEIPAWLKGKLEDVHVKPGQGSIFAKSVDEILKLAQNLLDKTNPKELDKIANSTGTLTMNVPGAGYNLVLPIEQAKKLPRAQESEVEKQEGPNKVKVPAITTTAPLTQFKTNELTVIVRPKKDEAGAVIPNEYIVLSVFPGDPDIPRASEWNGKYAVVIPGGKAELKEAQGYTAKGKEMELILNNFPSVSIDVDIENGVVTKVNGDIEKESIYSYDENNFAAALKPFKDAGVKVDYTPWTSSGGDDYEGYFNIDALSLNNAIASKKITIKSDLEDPEEYLVLAGH